MANGLAKNWEHIREEVAGWRSGMAAPWREFQNADGVPETVHKAMNLVTESARLLPYTIAHVFVIAIVGDGALHVWLWLR